MGREATRRRGDGCGIDHGDPDRDDVDCDDEDMVRCYNLPPR